MSTNRIADDRGVIICTHVLRDERPILLATREVEDWQFLCAQDDHPDAKSFGIVRFDELSRRHPDVEQLADLPEGWEAERATAHSAWTLLDLSRPEIAASIERDGFHVAVISGEDLSYAYTIGLSGGHGHPELAVFGLGTERMQGMLRHLAGLVLSGKRLEPGNPSRDVFDDANCYYVEVSASNAQSFFPSARAFYGNTPDFLQVVWPDNADKFPWEATGSDEMKRVQPLLGPKPDLVR